MNKRRILTIALCVSVFANLLFIGYIFGRETKMPSPELSMDPSYGFPRLIRALPEERKTELISSIRDHLSQLRGEYQEVGQAQATMFQDFLADPFDIASLRKSSAFYGDALCSARASADTVFLQLVEQLTHEERRVLLNSARHEWRRVNRRSQDLRRTEEDRKD